MGLDVLTAIQDGLTRREREVLDLIEQRLSIKEIAATLEVSDSTVNKTISTLKAKLGGTNHRALVEAYRRLHCAEGDYSKPVSSFSSLSRGPIDPPLGAQDAIVSNDLLVELRDATSWRAIPPWESDEPMLPGALNGKHAGWVRAALIGSVALLSFILVVTGLGLVAARGLTDITTALPPPRHN